MIEFKIIKKSKKSRARLGFLKTRYGVVETPCLVPVATQGVVKTLTSEEVAETKTQILIANTFHLHLKPGENVVKESGGLHKFMNWKGSLMTDSGGFQVFSLGFGKDFNVGKILAPYRACPPSRVADRRLLRGSGTGLKYFPDSPSQISQTKIWEGKQPKSLKITQDGVYFQSPLDGKSLFLGPKESIQIQEKLGADIIFAFDECTSPLADFEYTKKSLLKTHKWAEICLKEKKTGQALFGIVQGGKYKNLRIESAKFIRNLPFDGFGIGGEFGDNKKALGKMLNWVVQELPEEKPRHLLGIGKLEDIEEIIKQGIDLFDCTVPTHYARRGIAFTDGGKLDLNKSKFLKDPEGVATSRQPYGAGKNPLDKNCSCSVCQNYKRNYICHLLRANEITALKLLTFHNLYFFNTFIELIRKKIKCGKI